MKKLPNKITKIIIFINIKTSKKYLDIFIQIEKCFIRDSTVEIHLQYQIDKIKHKILSE